MKKAGDILKRTMDGKGNAPAPAGKRKSAQKTDADVILESKAMFAQNGAELVTTPVTAITRRQTQILHSEIGGHLRRAVRVLVHQNHYSVMKWL